MANSIESVIALIQQEVISDTTKTAAEINRLGRDHLIYLDGVAQLLETALREVNERRQRFEVYANRSQPVQRIAQAQNTAMFPAAAAKNG